MYALIGLLVWLATGTVAIAQEALESIVTQPALLETTVAMDPVTYILHAVSERWPWLIQLGAMAIAMQIALRGIADLLLLISSKTENKEDDKLAFYVSQASWYLGALVGKMGWGTPKAVLAEKAKEIVADGGKEEQASGEAPKAG